MGTTDKSPRALVVNRKDNVAILLDSAASGKPVTLLGLNFAPLGTVNARESIGAFHKVGIREIPEGESIFKLGEVIGRASCPIARGDHVHVHNVVSARLSRGGT